MVREMQNGKVKKWVSTKCNSKASELVGCVRESTTEYKPKECLDLKPAEEKCSWWSEYRWIFCRIMQQIWREKVKKKMIIKKNSVLSIVLFHPDKY